MKKNKITQKSLFLFLFILCVWIGGSGDTLWANPQKFVEHEVTIPLRFDYYYSYDMVVSALQKLHQTYPQLTKLVTVGKSEEGRGIYCMIINNPKTGNELEKPGIYVDGNIHGNEIQAGEVCLYLLDYLLDNYGKNKEITQLVDQKAFYVLPVVNVDGRYHFLKDCGNDSSNRSIRIDVDDDRDGLVNEDGPDDLDGDGNICEMRKRDPSGMYKTDPQDPRLMIRIKPGETGEWRRLGNEGIDNDGDGRINEDGEGYVDGNRNWGFDWMPPYVQEGSGDYPFSGIGIKAIAQFIQDHPNICITWAFHNFGGMYLRGPSAKNAPEFHPEDIKVYDYLGYQAERITPGYRYLISWKDLYTTYGDFDGWTVNIMGCYAMVGELYVPQAENFKTISESKKTPVFENNNDSNVEEGGGFLEMGVDVNRERIKFNDHLTQSELYKPWTPYKHPVYGDIEIGGWVKESTRLSPPFLLKDLVHRNASTVIFCAKHTPDVSIQVFEKKKIGKDLYRVRVRLTNTAAMPTMTYMAKENKLYPMDTLKVTGKNIKVVAGGVLKDSDTDLTLYKEFRPEVQFLFVPGFGKVEHEFLISGNGEVYFNYSSNHAGKRSLTVHLE